MPTQPDTPTPRTTSLIKQMRGWSPVARAANLTRIARQLERETIAQAEEIRRLREGIQEIASLKTRQEIEVDHVALLDDYGSHDFEAAYDQAILVARALLNPPTKES